MAPEGRIPSRAQSGPCITRRQLQIRASIRQGHVDKLSIRKADGSFRRRSNGVGNYQYLVTCHPGLEQVSSMLDREDQIFCLVLPSTQR